MLHKLDMHLENDNKGRSKTILYDTRNNFSFFIVDSTFLRSNITSAPEYGENLYFRYNIQELSFSITVSLIEVCCLQRRYKLKVSS